MVPPGRPSSFVESWHPSDNSDYALIHASLNSILVLYSYQFGDLVSKGSVALALPREDTVRLVTLS